MVKYSAWTLFLLPSVFLAVQVLSQDFNLEDALGGDVPPTVPVRTTKAPPSKPNAPAKPKPGNEFDLADALQPNIDKPGKPNKERGGGLSDDDLFGVAKDDTYKPDKGKGNQPGYGGGETDKYDDQVGTTTEIGTIGGIVSAVAVALVGAITSYISYQKKKFCFSIQQGLNTDVIKSEPDAVVATEPQVQQTLLEHPKAEPPRKADAPV